MLRIALVAVILAGSVGCSSTRQVAAGKPVEAPKKEYDYKDLSTGSSAFYRR